MIKHILNYLFEKTEAKKFMWDVLGTLHKYEVYGITSSVHSVGTFKEHTTISLEIKIPKHLVKEVLS
jgi:hypothetical protein